MIKSAKEKMGPDSRVSRVWEKTYTGPVRHLSPGQDASVGITAEFEYEYSTLGDDAVPDDKYEAEGGECESK